ncbi:hypothetical protein EDD28_1780 [Salana multivorans]|uniref:Glycosyl hydrolase family 43 n=1 Tax=Salana multivorans TaxID=120377 RepID=A0A3N2DBS8_9MICO|nr:glycoside hydrolase family 43 protein [Salana multivorans]ROR97187.1 hypothetical protein EDD28_1780 [Salana multivorans]
MFVLSYFTTEEESLHLALSEDGVVFHPVDDGRELLRGTVSTRALRDPFLHRTPDGVFHLLATDGWHSPDIIHASSTDLVEWSDQHTLRLMDGSHGTINTWAPECFVDDAGEIRLLWSSVLAPEGADDPETWEQVPQEHRIWTCTTRDFRTTTASHPFFDPGYSVIDATVFRLTDRFLMAFKDERGPNDLGGTHKNIRMTTFTSATGELSAPSAPVSPSPVEGPSIFRRRPDELVMIVDHFLEGRYSAVSSHDEGLTWQPTSVDIPRGARHASVLSVPDAAILSGLRERTTLVGTD